MRSGERWTEDEVFVALSFYRRTPFGQMHGRNEAVIALAAAMGRTPNALAMKSCNFASLDESVEQKGLSAVSSMDKRVWKAAAEMSEGALSRRVAEAMERLSGSESVNPADEDLPAGEEAKRLTKVRLGQSVFRSALLNAYGGRCCMSGLADARLLDACHIRPWSDVERRHRLSVSNGLLLDALHHRAFDKGVLSVQPRRLTIMVAASADRLLRRLDRKPIRKPNGPLPLPQFLEWHNDKVFERDAPDEGV